MRWINALLLAISLMVSGCEENRQVIAQGDWTSEGDTIIVVTQTPNPDGDWDGINDQYDCAPDDPTVSQVSLEICNSIDDDCDGLVDDEDPSVSNQQSFLEDTDGDGYGVPITSCEEPETIAIYEEEIDCNDVESPAINPDGHEVCSDGIDQDCDKQDLSCDDVDDDSDGFTENNGDCDDEDPEVNPEKGGCP